MKLRKAALLVLPLGGLLLLWRPTPAPTPEPELPVPAPTPLPAPPPPPAPSPPILPALVDDGDYTYDCDLGIDATFPSVELVEFVFDEGHQAIRTGRTATVTEGLATIHAASPFGGGRLHIPGHLPAIVAWSLETGGCEVVEAPVFVPAIVRGEVRTFSGDLPAGEITVTGCSQHLQGTPFRFELLADGGTCALVAHHRYGALSVKGHPARLAPLLGDELEVTLLVPDELPAGIGITLESAPEGIEILDVLPASPADRAGLRPGDLILSIDGRSTEGMSAYGFAQRCIGAPGSPVHLVVLTEEGERAIELVRSLLD